MFYGSEKDYSAMGVPTVFTTEIMSSIHWQMKHLYKHIYCKLQPFKDTNLNT